MARIFAMPVDVDFTEERRRERQEFLAGFLAAEDEIAVEAPATGARFLESTFDQTLTARGILELGAQAQAQGYDALAILCMTDPFVDALRELVDIPVIGSAQATAMTAVMCGGRFSVISTSPEAIPVVERAVEVSGVDRRAYVSTRAISMTIAEMIEDPAEVLRQLEEQAIKAIRHDGARAIVLGCTEMGNDTAPQLSERIGVPVIDANVATVQFARAMVAMGYDHSRVAYPRTPWTIEQRFATAADVGRAEPVAR